MEITFTNSSQTNSAAACLQMNEAIVITRGSYAYICKYIQLLVQVFTYVTHMVLLHIYIQPPTSNSHHVTLLRIHITTHVLLFFFKGEKAPPFLHMYTFIVCRINFNFK